MQEYIKSIPETSFQSYISGWEALNVKDIHGFPADWHWKQYWVSCSANDTIPLYENPILGALGIEHREICFSKGEKVYIADFPRAFADLVYFCEDPVYQLRWTANELLTVEEKQTAFAYILRFREEKELHEYLTIQFPGEYRVWREAHGV